MKKKQIKPLTDLGVLILRTVLMGRIRLLNTFIIIFGLSPSCVLIYHYIRFQDLNRTASIATWVVLISAIIVALLLIYRKYSMVRIPTYPKPLRCRVYRIISNKGEVNCYFSYQNLYNPLLEKITKCAVLRQIDRDIYSDLLVQVAVHYPEILKLDIPIGKLGTNLAHIQCQRLNNAEFVNFLRTVKIDKEPNEAIKLQVSHYIDYLVSFLHGSDRFDKTKLEKVLSTLTQDKDFAYQQVYNQVGYKIISVAIKSKT